MFKIPMWKADPQNVALGDCGPDAKVALCKDETRNTAETETLPPAIAAPPSATKSAAQWAYERMILYIQNFEKNLDDDQEVGIAFVSGGEGAGVMRITGMGYFAPDMVTFYGVDPGGAKAQLVQHVSQLNVMLKAAPLAAGESEARRIGFDLRRELEQSETDAAPGESAAPLT